MSRTPRVPGEVVAAPVVEQAPQAEETVTVSKAQLDALMSRLERLESQPSPASRQAQSIDLPDESEVNPDQIKSPVLTKQGWVVPTAFGANPAAKAL